jgi:hypothetical protein
MMLDSENKFKEMQEFAVSQQGRAQGKQQTIRVCIGIAVRRDQKS